jgi:pyrimidine-specific ribonucleoside hydrolase
MLYARHILTALLVLFVNAAFAHDANEQRPAVVIDTDMGLDDAVTLALALQCPDVDVVAIVACEGAAGREAAVQELERMLVLFNRPDIPLYAPPEGPVRPVPTFRSFAEESVAAALSAPTAPNHRPFSADAYGGPRNLIVLALGPLTNLAAALKTKPDLKDRLERVIIAGPRDSQQNWNLAYDAEAWQTVSASELPLEFVIPSSGVRKPQAWRHSKTAIGQATSIGESFIQRLLTEPRAREHYASKWPGFSDELVLLYCADREGFARDADGIVTPRYTPAVLELFTRCVSDGRQHAERVVLQDIRLPEAALRPDLRQKRASIIAKNGEVEWFAELVTSEMHDHLGAYSVIGAKMGLRAAELLNAPPHAMKVTSYTAAEPPVSCLNDGVIVASGSTPGRALFTPAPVKDDSTKVAFAYNGRELVLQVKAEYRQKITAEIQRLVAQYGVEQKEYWDGVRALALEIWENWHRRDIFDASDPKSGSVE